MASSTPNINLTLPVGSENVNRQIINDNNTKIDTAIGAVPPGNDLQSQVTALNNNISNYIKWKVLSGTTNQNGLVDTGITTNTGTVIYAANVNGDNGFVCTPYRISQSNSNQMIYVINASNGNRVTNTSVKLVLFILTYDIGELT